MGRHGAAALLAAAQARGRGADGKLRVLTHCNTGSLATAAFGTALGVVRTLHLQGQLEHAYCTGGRCLWGGGWVFVGGWVVFVDGVCGWAHGVCICVRVVCGVAEEIEGA